MSDTMCCYDFRKTNIFGKLVSFTRIGAPFLLVCIPWYSNYYFSNTLMHLFLYLFWVSGIDVKSFHGSRKNKTLATRIKILNTKISSDEDLADGNSLSITHASRKWEGNSVPSRGELKLSLLLNLSLSNQFCKTFF